MIGRHNIKISFLSREQKWPEYFLLDLAATDIFIERADSYMAASSFARIFSAYWLEYKNNYVAPS